MSKSKEILGAVFVGAIINHIVNDMIKGIVWMVRHPIWTFIIFLCVLLYGWTYQTLGLGIVDVPAIFAMNEQELDEKFDVIDCDPVSCQYAENDIEVIFENHRPDTVVINPDLHNFALDEKFYRSSMRSISMPYTKPIVANIDTIVWQTREYNITLTIDRALSPRKFLISKR